MPPDAGSARDSSNKLPVPQASPQLDRRVSTGVPLPLHRKHLRLWTTRVTWNSFGAHLRGLGSGRMSRLIGGTGTSVARGTHELGLPRGGGPP